MIYETDSKKTKNTRGTPNVCGSYARKSLVKHLAIFVDFISI